SSPRVRRPRRPARRRAIRQRTNEGRSAAGISHALRAAHGTLKNKTVTALEPLIVERAVQCPGRSKRAGARVASRLACGGPDATMADRPSGTARFAHFASNSATAARLLHSIQPHVVIGASLAFDVAIRKHGLCLGR